MNLILVRIENNVYLVIARPLAKKFFGSQVCHFFYGDSLNCMFRLPIAIANLIDPVPAKTKGNLYFTPIINLLQTFSTLFSVMLQYYDKIIWYTFKS